MTTPKTPLPCVVCGRVLQPVFADFATESGYVQPDDANTLSTTGTYGSTVFDPVDGTELHLNICDPCMVTAIEAGRTNLPSDYLRRAL